MSAKPCSQEKCPNGGGPAIIRFFWPGSEDTPREVCLLCAAWAAHIADVLGFKLRCESMLTGQEGDAGPSRFALIEIDDNDPPRR